MSKLLLKASKPNDEGRRVCVTPQSAGWKFVGFELYSLRAGQKIQIADSENEICVLLLSGRAEIQLDGQAMGEIGERTSPFEGPPYAVYAPAAMPVDIMAAGPLEFAVCKAPGPKRNHDPLIIRPADTRQETRGKQTNTRHVCNILEENDGRAENLLVVEVITPSGCWSSYPPHKHDEDNLPHESALEEIYYHRFNPPQGFGFQRIYTDDRALDESFCIKNEDVVLVPRGYHPCGSAHGYALYYLNVMAGPQRIWRFHNDPEHEWMLTA